MYDELYEAWKRELENADLEKLPLDFNQRIADYLRKLKDESRMLDRRTVKARLLRSESRNVKRLLLELIQTRYRKLIGKARTGDVISHDGLMVEEKKLLLGVSSMAEAYEAFIRNLLQGRVVQIGVRQHHKYAVLRFLKNVPAIIGADVKPYGPFEVEDVASLPNENAEILIKQRFAERVEVNGA